MPTLTLKPSQEAVRRKLAGFYTGTPLKVSFMSGETCQAVLDRFNTYRGPDSQIEKLLTSANQVFPLATVLQKDLELLVP